MEGILAETWLRGAQGLPWNSMQGHFGHESKKKKKRAPKVETLKRHGDNEMSPCLLCYEGEA